ncbi:MAG: winged helix-turn-helix domain-containing protein [Thermoleophilia bacterium]
MGRASQTPSHGSSWLVLDRRGGETRRACLERTLREAIASGALRAGAPLPSSRSLAAQLGLSRGVVTEAYAQLAAQGSCSSAHGSRPSSPPSRRRVPCRRRPVPRRRRRDTT